MNSTSGKAVFVGLNCQRDLANSASGIKSRVFMAVVATIRAFWPLKWQY
ncbi:hypothetical protein N9M41_00520 [Rhodopirellula sp.]|nr:hypothetical protein [Rhodopirellula sp.]